MDKVDVFLSFTLALKIAGVNERKKVREEKEKKKRSRRRKRKYF